MQIFIVVLFIITPKYKQPNVLEVDNGTLFQQRNRVEDDPFKHVISFLKKIHSPKEWDVYRGW